MWNAQSEKDPTNPQRIAFGLFHRKCNHAALRSPVPLRIFHGQGYVDITKGNQDEWGGKSLTHGQRIAEILSNGPKQFGQIVEAMTDVKKDVITTTLSRLHAQGVLAKTGQKDEYWQKA